MHPVESNLAKIRREISSLVKRLGQPADSVQLLAVSKTFPLSVIEQAVAAGQASFGENRIQEAEQKVPQLSDVQWHLIGPIQSNKARRAVQIFDVIQTLDRAKIIRRVGRFCHEEEKTLRVYLQINVGAEAQKHGVDEEEAHEMVDLIDSYPRLQLQGLMCIPPYDPDPEASRPYYLRMRTLLGQLNQGRDTPLRRLSMGMSHDYRVAIQEGATLVRVGTAIFGRRTPPA